MIFSFHSLQVFFTQSVAPVSLLDRAFSEDDFNRWKKFLANEGQNFILALKDKMPDFVGYTHHPLALGSAQKQWVMLSDEINFYLFRQKKIWSTHVNADMIKIHYLYSLSFIDQLLGYWRVNFPEYYDRDVKLTDFCLKNKLPQLRHQVSSLQEILKGAGINKELADIVLTGLYNLLRSKMLSESNSQYITGLLSEIKTSKSLDENSLILILTKCNFNQPELYLYKVTRLGEKLIDINGLHEQVEFILQLKKEINEVKVKRGMSLHTRQDSLKKDLTGYFTEQISYLEEVLILRRAALLDKYESEKAFRLLVRLSVPQLALFFRVLMETGLLAKQDIREVFNFVAQHFYTEKTSFISSQNMLIKSSNVEFSSAIKIYDMLKTMIQWLDEKFNVKDFQH